MVIDRQASAEFKTLLKHYPVVTIIGPRQAGKTTLARLSCPDYSYCNLELSENRNFARLDPNGFLKQYPPPAIFDEIQNSPDLLSYIQANVDQNLSNGQYVLTGSNQFALSSSVTQTLAGRTALLTLWPFSIAEIKQYGVLPSRETVLRTGFLPRVHDQKQEPYRAYRNYFQTYVERDLYSIFRVKDLQKFEAFMRLMASRVGQECNASSLGAELGLSYKTILEWLSVLEKSFILFRLPPYFANFGKRLIKAPKYYFVEPGLVPYLLGIEEDEQLARDRIFGQLFENMVIVEACKARFNKGLDPQLYFFRDSAGHEVDLIFETSPEPIPIEIKSSLTFNSEFLKGIHYFCKLAGSQSQGHLVLGHNQQNNNPTIQGIQIHSFDQVASIFGSF